LRRTRSGSRLFHRNALPTRVVAADAFGIGSRSFPPLPPRRCSSICKQPGLRRQTQAPIHPGFLSSVRSMARGARLRTSDPFAAAPRERSRTIALLTEAMRISTLPLPKRSAARAATRSSNSVRVCPPTDRREVGLTRLTSRLVGPGSDTAWALNRRHLTPPRSRGLQHFGSNSLAGGKAFPRAIATVLIARAFLPPAYWPYVSIHWACPEFRFDRSMSQLRLGVPVTLDLLPSPSAQARLNPRLNRMNQQNSRLACVCLLEHRGEREKQEPSRCLPIVPPPILTLFVAEKPTPCRALMASAYGLMENQWANGPGSFSVAQEVPRATRSECAM